MFLLDNDDLSPSNPLKRMYSPTPPSSLNLEGSSCIAVFGGRPLEAYSERWIWGQGVGGERQGKE